MADNRELRGGSDRKRIDVHQDHELRDWSTKLGVSPERLKEAVQAVGDQADKVQEYLHRPERSDHEHPTAPRKAGKAGTSDKSASGKPDKPHER